MKTVTFEKFCSFNPCWLDENGGKERLKSYFDRYGGKMSALDILAQEDVRIDDRLWAVCREDLIDAPILHEFACICAEYALSLIDNPDPRSTNAINVKRRWLNGKATDKELAAACDAARAAAWAAACDAACDAAWAAAWAAACDAACDAAWAAACDAEIAILIMLLENDA